MRRTLGAFGACMLVFVLAQLSAPGAVTVPGGDGEDDEFLVTVRIRTHQARAWSGTVELSADGQTYAAATRWGAARLVLPRGTLRPYRVRLLTPAGAEQWSGQVWIFIPPGAESADVAVVLDAAGKPARVTIAMSYRVPRAG